MKVEMKSKVAIVISDKVDFKTESIIKDKEGHYIVLAKKFMGKPKWTFWQTQNNDKWINTRRGHKICKHIFLLYRST